MNFLGSYVDTIESIPLDLGRDLSKLNEIGAETDQLVTELNQKYSKLKQSTNDPIISELDSLLESVIGKTEEKLAIATKSFEFVDKQIKRLDDDLARFDADFQLSEQEFAQLKRQLKNQPNESNEKPTLKQSTAVQQEENFQIKRNGRPARRAADKTMKKLSQTDPVAGTIDEGQSKNSKGNSEQTNYSNEIDDNSVETPTPSLNPSMHRNSIRPIADSDEQKYCYCNQVSYGEMIACDNNDCDIEWFHYDCVGLKMPPKGKWYCDECLQKKKNCLLK